MTRALFKNKEARCLTQQVTRDSSFAQRETSPVFSITPNSIVVGQSGSVLEDCQLHRLSRLSKVVAVSASTVRVSCAKGLKRD